MSNGEDDLIRHSYAAEPELDRDPEVVARRESANALRQASLVRKLVEEAVAQRRFRLRPATILDLNRSAIEGLSKYAGVWRPSAVRIEKTTHQPPDAGLVPYLVEDMCDYVNSRWSTSNSIHLAAYVMWRLNWIHPFVDGNGRTARAASYYVLCLHMGYPAPGPYTIPEQIVRNRLPYYDALEQADAICQSKGSEDPTIVAGMEGLLASMLATQLKSAFDQATAEAAALEPTESEELLKSLAREARRTQDEVGTAVQRLSTEKVAEVRK